MPLDGHMISLTHSPHVVMNLGHNNGTVTLWTPNISTPVVKMLCHRGPVQGGARTTR